MKEKFKQIHQDTLWQSHEYSNLHKYIYKHMVYLESFMLALL